MILNYEHRQAGHCESGVTSNLLRNKGLNISEPMILGIGSGIFFSHLPFFKLQFAPVTTFRTLPGFIFNRSTKALGIEIYKKTFKNPHDSMSALDRAIEQGHPVGLQVGIYNLPFFPPEYRMHYNLHNLVVYGKENGEYLVSDTVIPAPVKISYNDLMKVRYPKGIFAPYGKMYYPLALPVQYDLHKAIVNGIRKASKDMIKIPFWMVGVKGIRFLAREMLKWEKKFGEQKANYYLGQVLRMEEEIGTGGAGFRFIYGAFLQEAAEILQNEKLSDISIEMGETANRWRDFSFLGAKNCKKRGGVEVAYQELAKILFEIADREKKIFSTLLTMKLD
jgi:hypothetical protein